MFGAEVIGLLALDVHHTDQTVLGNQRHRQLGAHFGIHLDVHLRGAHVVQQHRLAGERHLANYALAHGDVQPLNLRDVADLEPHPHFVGAVVNQQNGEDAVRNDGRHQLRGAPQQGFQIQRGVQRVGKTHQIGHIGRFHANIRRVKMRPRGRRVGRAVVALQLGFRARRWRSLWHRRRRKS